MQMQIHHSHTHHIRENDVIGPIEKHVQGNKFGFD
jgi:hypothetical protein